MYLYGSIADVAKIKKMGVISILHLNDGQQIKRLKSNYKCEHDVALQLNTKQIRSVMD